MTSSLGTRYYRWQSSEHLLWNATEPSSDSQTGKQRHCSLWQKIWLRVTTAAISCHVTKQCHQFQLTKSVVIWKKTARTATCLPWVCDILGWREALFSATSLRQTNLSFHLMKSQLRIQKLPIISLKDLRQNISSINFRRSFLLYIFPHCKPQPLISVVEPQPPSCYLVPPWT